MRALRRIRIEPCAFSDLIFFVKGANLPLIDQSDFLAAFRAMEQARDEFLRAEGGLLALDVMIAGLEKDLQPQDGTMPADTTEKFKGLQRWRRLLNAWLVRMRALFREAEDLMVAGPTLGHTAAFGADVERLRKRWTAAMQEMPRRQC